MGANSNLVNPDEPSVWGVDTRLAQFDHTLSQNRPALILVTGKLGSGKSSFMREVDARARKKGWKAAHSDGKGDLRVGPETREEDFSKRVLELLGFSPEEALAAARRDFRASAVRRLVSPEGPVQGFLPSEPAALAGARGISSAGALGESSQDTAGTVQSQACASPQTTPRPLHPLARQLGRLAQLSGVGNTPRGVLLLIDGYRPDSEFAEWFAGVLLRDVKRIGAPVVVVVADQTQNVQGLKPLADNVIPLGSLDRQDVWRRFEALGRELSPPIESSELDQYVKEALRRPQIIGPLRRVLLTRRGS